MERERRRKDERGIERVGKGLKEIKRDTRRIAINRWFDEKNMREKSIRKALKTHTYNVHVHVRIYMYL